jgi:8-oxo-dGTP pyrophosphatase MutT (NUDIX family)
MKTENKTKTISRKRVSVPIREDKVEHVEVHVAGICMRHCAGRVEVLAAKRTKNRELFPGKWECGGGQIRSGESFEEALTRQFYEEFGIMVSAVQPFATYEIIRIRKPKIPGLKFLCIPQGGGHETIRVNPREHSECRWISVNASKKLDFISGIHKDITVASNIYKQLFVPERSERGIKLKERIGFNPKGRVKR